MQVRPVLHPAWQPTYPSPARLAYDTATAAATGSAGCIVIVSCSVAATATATYLPTVLRLILRGNCGGHLYAAALANNVANQ